VIFAFCCYIQYMRVRASPRIQKKCTPKELLFPPLQNILGDKKKRVATPIAPQNLDSKTSSCPNLLSWSRRAQASPRPSGPLACRRRPPEGDSAADWRALALAPLRLCLSSLTFATLLEATDDTDEHPLPPTSEAAVPTANRGSCRTTSRGQRRRTGRFFYF
jgi:hypothetical protein